MVRVSRGSLRRYILGAILPGVIGAIVASTFVWLTDEGDGVGVLLFFSVFGVLLSILPAALYSYLMERYVNPRVSLNFDVIFLSASMGTLIGAIFVVMLPVGTIVGAIVGAILRYDYLTTTHQKIRDVGTPVRFMRVTMCFNYAVISVCYLCWFSLGIHIGVDGWSGIMSLLFFLTFLGCVPYLILVFITMLVNKALRRTHILLFYSIITMPLSVIVLLPAGIFFAKVIA